MPQLLHHLVYQSVATSSLEEPDLKRILVQARAWNADHGLTGVLLHSNGNLLQVLEGVEAAVRSVFARIARDLRHTNVAKLADGPIAQRQFKQWSMGFKVLNPADFAQLQGYIAPQQSARNAGRKSVSGADLHAVLAAFATDDAVRI